MPALQYEEIAELYDGYPGCYLEDIVFYAEEAKASGSPVLEIGVGTGRLAFCLAAIGIDVIGIDRSPAMLRVMAKKKAGLADLQGSVYNITADMRNFVLRARFSLAIIPFRTFLYLLTRKDQRRALRTIRRHLTPGGRLIMSFFVPSEELLVKGRTERHEMTRFPAPEGKSEVAAFDWTEFQPARQRLISHITYEWRDAHDRTFRQIEHSLTARYVFPEEMPPLLESCGYKVLASYGGFDRAPLTAQSREQIWIATPKQNHP